MVVTKDQKKDYYTVLTLDQLDDLIVNLKSSNLISLDLETTSTNPSIAEIVGLLVFQFQKTAPGTFQSCILKKRMISLERKILKL